MKPVLLDVSVLDADGFAAYAVSTMTALDVWIEARSGATNLGTAAGIAVNLENTTADQGDYWDGPVTVDGYTALNGVSFPFGTGTLPVHRMFMVYEYPDATGESASRRYWSNKIAVSNSAAAGFQMFDNAAGSCALALNVSDGTAGTTIDTSAADVVAAGGRGLVAYSTGWFGSNFVQFASKIGGTYQALVSDTSFGAIGDFVLPQDGIVFGAGCNSATTGNGGGPNASNEPDGADWRVIAGGYDIGTVWTDDQLQAIAAYYGV